MFWPRGKIPGFTVIPAKAGTRPSPICADITRKYRLRCANGVSPIPRWRDASLQTTLIYNNKQGVRGLPERVWAGAQFACAKFFAIC